MNEARALQPRGGRLRAAATDPATVVAALGLLAVAVLVLWLNRTSSFFYDDWDFLVRRRSFSADTFLEPHTQHLVAIPVAIYRLLVAVFGMDSNRPFQVVGVAFLIAALALAYVWIRRRIGPWAALAFVAPIAVCGPAWDNVLWPFQIGFTGALACGLAAMLLLERPRGDRDRWACALLVGSLAFSSLGLSFAFAAAVAIWLDAAPWRRRAYVVALPAALWLAWWLTWGQEADGQASLENLLDAPSYVFDGLASSTASWLGLGTVFGNPAGPQVQTLVMGRPVFVALVIATAVWLVVGRRRPSRDIWPPFALALSFWLLAAPNASLARLPTTSRYQLIGALFLAMIAAELLRGVDLRRPLLAALGLVAAAAVAGNVDALLWGRDILRDQSAYELAGYTAIELARDTVAPDFVPSTAHDEIDATEYLPDAAEYLSAVDAQGSPSYTDSELAAAPEQTRERFDQELAAAVGLGLTPAASSASGCPEEPIDDSPIRSLPAPGRLLIAAPRSEVGVYVRRYADEFPVWLGNVAQGSAVVLDVPRDRSPRPWQLQLTGTGVARICPEGPA